jgi:ABC-2 type transport system permease protein
MRSLLPNAWHVARREYLLRVRSRTFIVVTGLLAVVGFAIALLPLLIRLIGGDEVVRLAVYADDAQVQATTVGSLGGILGGSEGDTTYEVVAIDDASTARQQVAGGDFNGLVQVSRGADEDLGFEIVTDAGPTSGWLFTLRQAMTQVSIGDRLLRAGVDASQVGEIFAPTPIEVTPVDPEQAQEEDEAVGADYVLAYALVILTFMAVVTYGTWVANSVAEEKSSRVMELLVTAATPRQLLAGKVLGTGTAGLTQYGVVVVAALGGLLAQGSLARSVLGSSGSSLEGMDLFVLIPFGIFFISGFMLYAALYAGLGSMASRQEDVQQVTGPMLIVGMGGYFASFIALNIPDAAWVKTASLIPFFSPYMLPMRLLLDDVAAWEWAVAAVLMVLFLLAALWLSARIYSAGVLLYGQRVGLRSALRAARIDR